VSDPREHVVLHRSRRRAECTRLALALRAMGIAHEIRPGLRQWVLTVPADQAREAAHQLDAYARENRNWPARRAEVPHHPISVRGIAAYAAVLCFVAVLEHDAPFGLDWFGAGRLHTEAIRDGEWWRTITALTLHLDMEHLLGNLIVGAVFGLIAGQLLGNGLAWFSILLGGALGNGVSALVQAPEHVAVGASTAVFAALGLWAAYVWRRRIDYQGRWAFRWAPVIAAVVLLAYTGSGGPRTDVIAHLSGFAAGFGLGVYYGGLGPGIVVGTRGQRWYGVAALALLIVSWAIALAGDGGAGA
jgi:membrane associated rhomboid family serine protease